MKQLRHQKKIVQKEDVGSNRNCQSENTAKGFSEEYERFLDVDTIETNCPILRKGKIEQEKEEVYLLEHIWTPSGVSDSLNDDLEKSETIGFSVLEKSHYIDFCF